jgi:hypothetical protein
MARDEGGGTRRFRGTSRPRRLGRKILVLREPSSSFFGLRPHVRHKFTSPQPAGQTPLKYIGTAKFLTLHCFRNSYARIHFATGCRAPRPSHPAALTSNEPSWLAAAGRRSFCTFVAAVCGAPRPSRPHAQARGDIRTPRNLRSFRLHRRGYALFDGSG